MDLLAELDSAAEDKVDRFARVLIYAGLGQFDDALKWLEKAMADRGFDVVTYQTDPLLSDVRTHPGYAVAMERAGFPVP